MSPSDDEMLVIEDLVVRYGELTAVDGVTLRVPRGSLFGFLGPNGAGKTTTLSCVAGLQAPTRGTITVAGFDVATQLDEVKRRIGLVPQSLALYGTLTVNDNLKVFAGLYGLKGKRRRERMDWALAMAQLESRAEERVDRLSGGMKRRLNLVCSLLHEPELIICDEPTTGVDPQSRNHLFESIRALRDEGRTIVYTTHYMEEVQALCDRVAIIDRGRIIADDTLDALLRDAPTRFEVTLEQGSGVDAVRASLGDGGLPVAEVTPLRRTLEEVFLELTGRELRDDP